MDVIKEFVVKVNFGDEKVMVEFWLINMVIIEFLVFNEVIKDRFECIFIICVKVVIVGKVLGLECIKVFVLNVMGLI